jgi:membrane protein implicated in regulation of membrane protease activity
VPISAISLGLIVLAVYLGVGVLFALAFVIRGAAAMDPVARTTPLHVRIILLPGATALWPMLLVKWFSSPSPTSEND